jgi:replicative DNA helicase
MQNNLTQISNPDRPRIIRLGDLLEEWDTFAEQAYNARQGHKPLGVATGLERVDAEIGGIFQPGLHSLQGGTGAGKTAFALQVSTSCGLPALYVTCEMAPLELLRRITARITGTFLGRLKSGELTPEQSRQLVNRAITVCPDLVILDATRFYVPAFAPAHEPNAVNIFDLAEITRGLSEHILVVIDSVHSWADAAPSMLTEYERLNAGLSALRGLAASLNGPVLCIAERNRAGMERGGVNAGAGSRKIEYGAESVIELNRDADSKPDSSNEVEVTLKLSKNRNGSIGQPVELRFNGALQRYREL